jgi:hypothetical protein
MKSWNIAPMLILTGALLTPAAYAAPEPGAGPVIVDDRLPSAPVAPQTDQGLPGGALNGRGTAAPKSVEGTVAAVDHQSGRFVLDTSEGPITLMTTPDELAGVQIGDVVQVSLVQDEPE